MRRHVGDGRETVGVQVPGGAMGRKRSARGAGEARGAREKEGRKKENMMLLVLVLFSEEENQQPGHNSSLSRLSSLLLSPNVRVFHFRYVELDDS